MEQYGRKDSSSQPKVTQTKDLLHEVECSSMDKSDLLLDCFSVKEKH